MAKKKNTEILEQVVKTGSSELQERLATTPLEDGGQVYSVLKDYPTAKNEFINTLTNKIVGSKTYSKIYENQLKMLHKGKLPFGVGLEQLFVEMGQSKGFLDHFDGSTTDEGDLIRKLDSDVKSMYIERNYRLKYKTSLSEQQLRAAFMNAEGLSGLIGQLTSRNASSAEFEEFNMMKNIIESSATLKNLADNGRGVLELSDTAIPSQLAKQPMARNVLGEITNKEEFAKNLTEQIRATVGRLRFPSTKYNLAGVRTWSDASELVLLTTPEVSAMLDVRVLAQAFNVSEADLNVRVIIVDELPKGYATSAGAIATEEDNETYAILMDASHIQAYDTLVESGNFWNPEALVTNLFLHRQGIMAQCLFANIVAFTKK